ncbi:MAG: chaperone modulator CbpM [Pseudomonadota bacterium]|nr:chaperone modulator CbpM [Pseudomonadota bacterium]
MNNDILSVILDDSDEVTFATLADVCRRTRLEEHFIIECVEHGIAHVAGDAHSSWRFSVISILRLQKAWRLHRDLELQVSSLPLVLDLLEERDQLRQQLDELRARLGHWELR